MARPIEQRQPQALGRFRISDTVPGIIVEPEFYFTPPRGLNSLASINRLPKEFTPYLKNLILDQGLLRSRPGVSALGNPFGSADIMAIMSFKAPDSSGRVFRLTTTGIDEWNGTDWNTLANVFTGTINDRFTWTGFGNKLLMCNGVDKIVSLDVMTGEIETLDESVPCRHLTTFSNRVIASAVTEGSYLGYRSRWSVKNDHRDWTSESTDDGIGAGYEDLLGGSAGYVDEVMGVYPLTDDTALMVREKSLWNMYLTGDVLAPFRFSRITSEVGSRARHSIQATPHGIVMLSQEDVIVANQSGFQSIGEAIRRELHASINNYGRVSALYDPDRQEYRLSIGSRVWRWNFVDKGWTRDEYHFDVTHMSYFDYRSLGLTFDELEGTFDELLGTFDEQVRAIEDKGVHFVARGENQVVGEDDALAVPIDLDTDPGIEIRTGLLQAATVLDKTELIELQLEYESDSAQTLYFEYTYDRGSNWFSYSSIPIAATTGPQVLAVRRTLVSHNLQLRMRADTLGTIKVHSLAAFVNHAARVNP